MTDHAEIDTANLSELIMRNAVVPRRNGDSRRCFERQGSTADANDPQPDSNEPTPFANYSMDRQSRVGDTITVITERLEDLTGGWPKRVGNALFCVTPDHQVQWLDTPPKLFAWIEPQAKVVWAHREDMVTQERFYAHLQMNAEAFDAVELIPHWPAMPRTYYVHPPLPAADGRYFEELLQHFCPATEIDRQLLRAFFLSIFWGGPAGQRPAWAFTGLDDDTRRGRGIGKSTVPAVAGMLTGGCIEVSPQETITDIKKRLLSSDAQHLRIARLDNVKTFRFSWADLEGLITSPTISGHRMYSGEGRRPNTFTWTITLNGASMSSDMADRSIIVVLGRPAHSDTWENEVRDLVERHRWEIISDIIGILQQA